MTFITVVEPPLPVYLKQENLLAINKIIISLTEKISKVSMTVGLPVVQSGDP